VTLKVSGYVGSKGKGTTETRASKEKHPHRHAPHTVPQKSFPYSDTHERQSRTVMVAEVYQTENAQRNRERERERGRERNNGRKRRQ
jgi:hypothetical protein